LVTMALFALSDDFPRRDIERREKSCGSVTDVIVSAAFRISRRHREHGLGTIQRVDPGLLVDGEHQRTLWRVHIQPDDITDLFNKVGIVGEFERAPQMGLKAKGMLDTPHRTLRHPRVFGHSASGPLRGIFRFGLESLCHDFLDPGIVHRPRCSRSGSIVQLVASKPLAPVADRGIRHPESTGHLATIQVFDTSQHNSRPQRQGLSRLAASRPTLQFLSFLGAEDQRFLRSSSIYSRYLPKSLSTYTGRSTQRHIQRIWNSGH